MRNLEDNDCCVYCGEKTNIRKLVTLDTINGKEIINVSLCPNHLNKTHKEIRDILGIIN